MKRTSGIVRKQTIVLDDPIPELGGKRVMVEIVPADSADEPTLEELEQAWKAWAARPEKGFTDEDDDWQ